MFEARLVAIVSEVSVVSSLLVARCAVVPAWAQDASQTATARPAFEQARAPVWVREPDEPSRNLLYDIQNPFAFIPRLPIENEFDFGAGSTNAMTYRLTARPVLPFHLTESLALITRTTIPLIYQEPLERGQTLATPQAVKIEDTRSQVGLGDIDQELYLSPEYALGREMIVGVGPIIRWPTATTNYFGGQLWGLGPAGAVIWQPAGVDIPSGWTLQFYGNHLFDIAGRSKKFGSLSTTYLQPVVSYTTEGGTSFSVDTQSVYDWVNNKWVVPVNFTVSQLMTPAGQPIVVTLGGRYYAERAAGGPEWGGQLGFNFPFPD